MRCFKYFGILILTLLFFVSCENDDPINGGNGSDPVPPDWSYNPSEYDLKVPQRLPQPPDDPENPLTDQGVKLGRMLFYDPILSGDSTQACASCHMPENSFAEPLRVSEGINGIEGTRNAPAIINVAYMPRLFWDGRALSLEEQAIFPITSHIEMDNDLATVVKRLKRHEDYPKLFYEAFGEYPLNENQVLKAIAQFERILLSGNSKFDKSETGSMSLTPQENLGLAIYMSEEKGDCWHCHGNPRAVPLLTDNIFHDTGLDPASSTGEYPDPGLGGISGRISEYGEFKTPTLRNIELTAPYMHDGRFQTLEEVVEFYMTGGNRSINQSPLMRHTGEGIDLNEEEKEALIAFLKTLTDTEFINNPEFQNPFPE